MSSFPRPENLLENRNTVSDFSNVRMSNKFTYLLELQGSLMLALSCSLGAIIVQSVARVGEIDGTVNRCDIYYFIKYLSIGENHHS